jgi:acetyl esterase
MLDPRVRCLLWLIRLAGKRFRPGSSVAAVRAGYRELNLRFGFRRVEDVETRLIEIPVSGGTIAGRLSAPLSAHADPLPVLLYFHGGGWVIGDAESYDHLTRYLAHKGRIGVLSVDYRMGPEHPIPAPFEDGFDAYAWLIEHATTYGLDPNRIAVGGDSAGGSIAAAISAFGCDRGLSRPAYQLLIYPPLDGTLRYPSRSAYRSGDLIVPALREWFKAHALSRPEDITHPFLRLVDAPKPEDNPPTYFLAAGYDSLIDEGRAYVERLRSAGVDVTYDLRESLPHGLVNVARVTPAARKAVDAAIGATSRALGAA